MNNQSKIKSVNISSKNYPRLLVFRSNRAISGQINYDKDGKTICAVTSKIIKQDTPLKRANEAGKQLAKHAKKSKISKVVFDRGKYLFHGQVKAFAEGARQGGLKF